ncbi:MAG: hypothetical protein Q8K60_02755 [Parachlamydiaceae bacterium]|nr:hypothetical protein [Parachlamydiaceae bacterium]
MTEINSTGPVGEGNTFSQDQYNLSAEAAAKLHSAGIPVSAANSSSNAAAEEIEAKEKTELEEEFTIWDTIQAFVDNIDENQKLAIEQGEYLQNLNQESIALTIQMSQIPKVKPEDLGQDPSNEDTAEAFNSFNNNDLALLYQDIQRDQDVIDQAAKQQQSFMTQTTDTINDDANTLKSLLEVMGQLYKAFSSS